MADRGHGDRVDHLLMKLRIGLRGSKAVLSEQPRIRQVDRVIEGSAGRVPVDHLDIFADRPFLELLPWYLDGNFTDARHVILACQAGIERKYSKTP